MAAYLKTGRWRTEAWHGMAQEVGNGFIGDGELPSEAGAFCGMDQWSYRVEQLYRVVPGEGDLWPTKEGVRANGVLLDPVGEGKLVTVAPDGEEFTIPRVVVSYDPLQPKDMLSAMDEVAQQHGAQLEGVFLVGKNGEGMGVQFERPNFDIKGDEFRAFLTFTDDKTGSGGMSAGITTVRIVCNNTFRAAVESDSLKRLGHSNSALTVSAVATVFAAAIKTYHEEIDFYNRLFTMRYKEGEFNQFAEAVFPYPQVPAKMLLYQQAAAAKGDQEYREQAEKREAHYQNAVALADMRRLSLAEKYHTLNDTVGELPQGGQGTFYAGMNALTLLLNPDHTPVYNGKKLFNGQFDSWKVNTLMGKGQHGTAMDNGRNWLLRAVS